MNGEKFTLIDTAGMRRKRSIKEDPEKFSVSKSIDSIKRSDLVILLVDGSENIVDQDTSLGTNTSDRKAGNSGGK